MRRKFICICMALCFAAPAYALKVERASLGHGVEAWYAESTSVPIVDVMLTFEGAGNASDPEGKGGLANLVAGMLDEGAGDLNAQAFAQALEEKAITFSADANADNLTIRIRCLREHSARAGDLLALALTKTTLPEASLTQVKTQLATILSKLEENPQYHVQKLLTKRAFAGHPYANMSYGTPQSIASLGADDVRHFMQTYLTRGNIKIAAAGDVDAALLKDMLKPLVEGLPGNEAGAVAVVRAIPQGGGETLTETTMLPQSVIAFVGPGVERKDKRFYAAYLFNHIVGGGSLTSRLGEALRQKNGLAYSVDTDLDVRRGTSMFSGMVATRNASTAEALAALRTQLAALHRSGVTTEECASAKSYVLGHFPLQMDRTAAVAGLLTSMQLYQLGDDYLETRIKYFSDVSCADINAVAQELTDPAKLLFAVVGGEAATATKPAPEAAAQKQH